MGCRVVAEPDQLPTSSEGGAGSDDGGPGSGFLVAGVGASAGGITALKALCGAVPGDADMALVVILHLDPHAHSTLPDLLAAQSQVPVHLARDGMPIEPRNIYVIPPGQDLDVQDGHLTVRPQESTFIRLPINHFLCSLAATYRDRAAAVILSGSGSDGSQGVRSVREEGGLTIVQDPAEAEYDAMPRNAIATDAIDLVLPAGDIPGALADYGRHRPIVRPPAGEAVPPNDQDVLEEIIALLRRAKAHDFSSYKPGTLMRRITRRMALGKSETPKAYLDVLRVNRDELDALFKDLLINVTEFFRDSESFAYLEQNVLPELVRHQTGDVPLRAWVPGCSSGEEAYSLGILLIEALTAADRPIRVQIFASDVDVDALETARRGVYPESIESNVSQERLNRFFVKNDHTYTVRPFLRECVVVSAQNLVVDPPFSNVDLVSCRNLLIYITPEMQDRILRVLHLALRPGGILFLGSSETVRTEHARFELVSSRHHVFRRIGRWSAADVQLPLAPGAVRSAMLQGQPTTGFRRKTDLATAGQRLIMENYAAASVIVDRRRTGLFYFGPVDRYLRVAGGEASHDIISMAREGLRAKLRAVLDEAIGGDGRGQAEGAIIERDGEPVTVNLAVMPVPNDEDRAYLLTFLEAPAVVMAVNQAEPTAEETGRIAELERELDATRLELRSMISDLETSNEELKAANEEAMSINEEFQSTNEELETSKEELQSVNEELSTVNAQLEERIEAQRKSANDLANLLASADVASLFLDRDLRIRFFTPAVQQIFPIVGGDVGRPLADFSPQLNDPGLLADAPRVLETLIPIQVEFEAEDGKWLSRRIVPYRTDEDRIDGVALSYVDVSEVKRAERAARAAQSYFENVVATVRDPLIVLDAELNVVTAGRSFYRVFGLGPAAVEGRNIRDIGNGRFDVLPIIALLEKVLPQRAELEDVEVDIDVVGRGRRLFIVSAHEIEPEVARGRLILLSLEDATERRRSEERFFQDVFDATADAVVVVDGEGKILRCNFLVEKVFGYRPDEIVGRPVEILIPERFRERHRGHLAAFFAAPSNRLMGGSLDLDIVGLRQDGTEVPLQVGLAALGGSDGPRAVASIRDITEQKHVKLALEKTKLQAERANALKSEFLDATGRSLAHPLHAMGILIGILGRTVVRLEAQESVSRLAQIASTMTDALNLLLDVTRLEAGTVVPDTIDYPINDTIARMQTEFAPVAQARQLELRVVPSHAVVHSDRQIVDRILQNFVSNALRFTHEGRVLVGCRLRGDRLSAEVWDTGPGIPADEMGRIFGEFQRFTHPNAPAGVGIGLGLYVAKGLADVLGCKLEARSLPGKGSMFALELPFVALKPEDGVTGRRPAPSVDILPEVLVVCSDHEERNLLATVLRLEGYKVRVAADASEALASFEGNGTTVPSVVVDEQAGDTLTGSRLLWSLRNAGHYGFRGIVTTDNETTEYAQQVAENGGIALVKPAKTHEIIAHVAQGFRENGLTLPDAQGIAVQARGREPDESEQPAIVAVAVGREGVAQRIVQIIEDSGRRTERFRTADELLARFGSAPPSCVVLGDMLPGPPIAAIISRLRSHPTGEIPVVIVTTSDSVAQIVAGVRAGAVDVIEVSHGPEAAGTAEPRIDADHVLDAVERAVANRLVIQSEAQAVGEARERLERLTPREREIATLLAAGHSNKEIATRLGLSGRTVENHRAQIRAKTHIRSVSDLVRLMEQVRRGT